VNIMKLTIFGATGAVRTSKPYVSANSLCCSSGGASRSSAIAVVSRSHSGGPIAAASKSIRMTGRGQ